MRKVLCWDFFFESLDCPRKVEQKGKIINSNSHPFQNKQRNKEMRNLFSIQTENKNEQKW